MLEWLYCGAQRSLRAAGGTWQEERPPPTLRGRFLFFVSQAMRAVLEGDDFGGVKRAVSDFTFCGDEARAVEYSP